MPFLHTSLPTADEIHFVSTVNGLEAQCFISLGQRPMSALPH